MDGQLGKARIEQFEDSSVFLLGVQVDGELHFPQLFGLNFSWALFNPEDGPLGVDDCPPGEFLLLGVVPED